MVNICHDVRNKHGQKKLTSCTGSVLSHSSSIGYNTIGFYTPLLSIEQMIDRLIKDLYYLKKLLQLESKCFFICLNDSVHIKDKPIFFGQSDKFLESLWISFTPVKIRDCSFNDTEG